MNHKVEVKLRNGAVGAAPDVGVFFRLLNQPESISEVVEFLACHGFPVGFEELDGIKFITTRHGDMQKIPFGNYVSITHAPDDSPHIIYFNTETFLKLYEIDKRHIELKLRNLLDCHPCAKRCNKDDYSFFMTTHHSQPALEILSIYATEFGKAFRMTHDGYVILTDSKGSIAIAEGQTVHVDADGVMTVVDSDAKPKFLSYKMRHVRETIGMAEINCMAIQYDGTSRCRFRILDQISSKPVQAKFLTNSQGMVLNVMGNQTPVNVGDYIVAHDLGTEYSKIEVVTASDFQSTYSAVSEEDIMTDKAKKAKKEKKSGKTLHNSSVSGARDNVRDIQIYGDGDTFKLICKASSEDEGWMKSTKAMEIPGVGCVVQVTTQQGDEVAEALAFVPGVRIDLINGDKKNGRRLVQINSPSQVGDVAEQVRKPVRDSLPLEGFDQFIAAQSNAHLFRGVFNVRRRAAYHDMARFDGTVESADQVVEWVNNSTDICRIVYDKTPATDSIALKWDGEFPLTPINVGDYIVHVGNGHFRVMSEDAARKEYDMAFDGNTDPVEQDEAVDNGPFHVIDKEGETAIAYIYDGSPAGAGVIVAAAQRCQKSTVCYGRNGLTIYNIEGICQATYMVQTDNYVVLWGDKAITGGREWFLSHFTPVLS